MPFSFGTYLIHSAAVGHMYDFQFEVAINSAAVDIFICTCLLVNLMAIFVNLYLEWNWVICAALIYTAK